LSGFLRPFLKPYLKSLGSFDLILSNGLFFIIFWHVVKGIFVAILLKIYFKSFNKWLSKTFIYGAG